MLNLNTPARIRAFFALPADDFAEGEREEIIADLEKAGLISGIIQATNNQEILGRRYTGTAAVRLVWILGASDDPADILAPVTEYVRVADIDPDIVYKTIVYGVSLEPRVQVALVEVNGGKMPNILPPVAPEPTPEPEEPTQEEPEAEPTEE